MTVTVPLEPQRLLTIEEAADRLRRTPASVRWLIFDGQLKSGKVGGRRLIRASDLEEFIDAGFAEAG